MKPMTYRPADEIAELLREAAFVARRSKQSIIDEAVRDWLDTKGKAVFAARAPFRQRDRKST